MRGDDSPDSLLAPLGPKWGAQLCPLGGRPAQAHSLGQGHHVTEQRSPKSKELGSNKAGATDEKRREVRGPGARDGPLHDRSCFEKGGPMPRCLPLCDEPASLFWASVLLLTNAPELDGGWGRVQSCACACGGGRKAPLGAQQTLAGVIAAVVIFLVFTTTTLFDPRHAMSLLSKLQRNGEDLSAYSLKKKKKATFPKFKSREESKVERSHEDFIRSYKGSGQVL